MMSPEALRAALHDRAVIVEFIKKSTGETRTMVCTLNGNMIPPEHYPKLPPTPEYDPTNLVVSEVVVKTPDPDLFKVYDLEASGWRSFRFSTVLNVYPPHLGD
jgi:hypothetical protein